jgi:hypothetical protein
MTLRNTLRIVLSLAILVMTGCGGGGGDSGGSGGSGGNTQPTTAVVTLATQGTLPSGTTIGGINVVLNYATNTGLSITDTNVVASGAGANPDLFTALTSTAGEVNIALIKLSGIQTGQFATATFSIAPGFTPTQANFSIAPGAQIYDPAINALSNINVVISQVVIH